MADGTLWNVSMFQSTLPRGERQRGRSPPRRKWSFNPRSHEGSDDKFSCRRSYVICFNPRSHEGSDLPLCNICHTHRCFNPRSHEGSDLPQHLRRQSLPGFNPRSHEGSDGISLDNNCPCGWFQSTLPRGERRKCC